MYAPNPKTLFTAVVISATAACSTNEAPVTNNSQRLSLGGTHTTLYDFEANTIPASVSANGGNLALVANDGGKALNVKLAGSKHYGIGLNLKPATPWDWSGKDNFGIAFDISNPGDYPTQLHLDLSTPAGSLTRAIVVPKGESKTYYAELKSPLMALDSGVRGDPPTILGDAEWMVWMWGNKQLDYSQVTSISLNSRGLKHDREIVIDNIRLVENPPLDHDFLTHIVDKYGQAAKLNFEGKILSDEQLAAETTAELEALAKPHEFTDRSRYGGWKNGPKLEATGYFRTEKVGDRWAMVDPEGYLFFSTGIANIRLTNNGTITGYQYDKKDVKQRTPEDLIPEHSVGLNLQPMADIKSRRVASELRKNMFEWLPEAGEPYSGHYGYRREVNVGSIDHGETFAFYRANLERKYAEQYPDFMAKWSEVALDRQRHWGFTSTGNWAEHSLYNKEFPYIADGWIIGDYSTVSSGFDFWGAIPDPFDPKFAERADLTVKDIASNVNNNPWCVGVFIDNEISWGRGETQNATYGIVINTLSRNAKETPAKAEFVRLLKAKYGAINAVNKAWETDIESWQQLADGVRFEQRNDAIWADFSMLLEAFASEYFRVVHDAMATHMPNHMYLGARMSSWARPIEVIRAAAKYNDVVSFNEYREVMHPSKWGFVSEVDKPMIIGEWHMGSMDRGSFHSGIVFAADQADRGRMYEEYMAAVLTHPNMVGAHWFQYTDSAITGRAMDGENYNVGFVSVTDSPYLELIESAKKVNRNLYETAFGELTKPK